MTESAKASESETRHPSLQRNDSGRRGFRFSELVEYRELFLYLVWRDIKVRYRQTVFGASWAVLQPFLLMVVFALFLGHLAKVPSEGIPYPVFAYAALVPWTFFGQGLTMASNSLVSESALVSKVYFPRAILPIATVASFVLDLMIATAVLGLLVWHYHATVTVGIAFLPLFALLAFVSACASGLFLAAVNVRYRDIKYAVPFIVQLWMFAAPVAYPSTLIPHRWLLWYSLNPLVAVVNGFRWALVGTPAPGLSVVLPGALVACGGLALAWIYFVRAQQSFADTI